MKNNILYEDNHIIAVNKHSGDLAQGDKTGDKPLVDYVKMYIKTKYHKPGNVFLGIPHRLDRPTSGVLLFAKTSKALTRLNVMFKEKKIEKTYWAVVKNPPPKAADILTHYLRKNQQKNKSFASTKPAKNSLKCILDYSIIAASEKYYLLNVVPHTGRHHQIRVQLSTIGCPIKGDIKYGFDRPNDDKSIHLHARSISFTHPVSKEFISIVAPPPKDVLWDVLKKRV